MSDECFLDSVGDVVHDALQSRTKCRCRTGIVCEMCELLELSDEIQHRKILLTERDKLAATASGGIKPLIEDIP